MNVAVLLNAIYLYSVPVLLHVLGVILDCFGF